MREGGDGWMTTQAKIERGLMELGMEPGSKEFRLASLRQRIQLCIEHQHPQGCRQCLYTDSCSAYQGYVGLLLNEEGN